MHPTAKCFFFFFFFYADTARDGGGVRGYSSLLIIEHIMEKIQAKYGLSDVPRPCDHFDLIGGTGTGG